MNRMKVVLLISILIPVSAYAQHDLGRNTVRMLANGKTDDAIKKLSGTRDRKDRPVGSADRCFIKAMAACIKGDAAEAFEHAKNAVENGLPAERFQAGPRDVFKPLYAYGPYKDWMKDKQKELIHGPMLGSVSDSSASFWVRTAEEADIRIVVKPVSEDADKETPVLTGKSRTSAGQDYTATVKVTGLLPDTRYSYEILVNKKRVHPATEFSTYPKQNSPAKFRIVFGGGAGYTPPNERMWTTIGKHKPLALLMLGDNVYIDDPEHSMTQRYCYYRRQSQPDWRRLVASTSVYSIYDDHDFGDNDCVPGPDIDKPAWKREVWKVFKQNWNNPSYGGGQKQPGCWYSFYITDVHFIMLDGRYYRDLKGGSMLGPVQKAWLFETLKASKGRFKILASPVPWSKGVKPGSKDTWDGYFEERKEVFDFISKNRIEGVVLMAADRHRSDLRKTKRGGAYDLYEVMSSRLTNLHVHKLMKRAKGSEFIMGFAAKCSFGLLEFDTIADDPQVKYTIVSIDGKSVNSRTLKLSELTFSDESGGKGNKGAE